jgi:hypothetical protein
VSQKPSPYNIRIQPAISQPINMSQSSSEARILLTLQALQDDLKITIRRAATIYNVNRYTLGRRQQGILLKRKTLNKSRLFSN